MVREGPLSALMWAWRRADSWEGVVPEGCPVRPYGPGMHLAEALRWVSSQSGASWPSLVRLGLVLRQEGLRECLEVMGS